MAERKDFYIGIDLDDTWAQISYCTQERPEPETVSMVAGEEHYRIPTALCRMPDSGAFRLPDSHGLRAAEEGVMYLDRLWGRSLLGERVEIGDREYELSELLLFYLKKLLRMVPGLSDFSQVREISFHLKQVGYDAVMLLRELMGRIGIEKEHTFALDDEECFCHFAMNQAREQRQHDNVLFLCQENVASCLYLTRSRKTHPVQLKIEGHSLGELPVEAKERDLAFSRHISQILPGKLISAAYLMGDGLEGGWMKQALLMLCRGRRVFQGRNLFTKGACCHSYLQAHKEGCDYIYFSRHKLKRNIFLEVREGERTRYYELAEAGESRYEASASCQALLSGEPEIDLWLREPDSREAVIQSLKLPELPRRPDKLTRLNLELYCGRDGQLRVRATDLGFGVWYPSSGKVWEYKIDE